MSSKITPHMLPPNFPLLDRDRLMVMIGHPTRLAILTVLCNGEGYGIIDLMGPTGSSAPNISKHLQQMRAVGILYMGRGKLYYVNPAFNPNPNSGILDFGHCLLRLVVQKPPAAP